MIQKILHSVFLLFILQCFSQTPVTIHLAEKEGLPDIEFYNILEDGENFIWLAADKGLFRYDGKEFLKFTHREQKGLSVFGLYEDNLNRVWCNNISGQFFYIQDNKLHLFIDFSEYHKTGELTDFIIKDNKLLIFAATKFFFVDLKTKKVILIEENSAGYGIPYLHNGKILQCDLSYFREINAKLNNTKLVALNLPQYNSDNSLIEEGKTKIFKIGNKFFFLKKRKKRNFFFAADIENKKIEKIEGLHELSNKQIVTIFENSNHIWFATNSGIYIYKYKNHKFIFEKILLKNEFITKIIYDNDGIFWITTLTNGIFVFPNQHIEEYPLNNDSKNIVALTKIDTNTVAFGTNKGDISIFNLKTNTETVINLDRPSRVSSLVSTQNKLYISKDDGGFVLSLNSLIPRIDNKLTSVKSFLKINNNKLFFVNPYNSYIRDLQFKKTDSLICNNRRGYASHYSSVSNEIYVAYVDNLVCFDKNFKEQVITYNNKTIEGVSFAQTNDNIVWVATFKNGVFGIKDNAVYKRISIENGLTSNEIEIIKADGDNLWIVNSKGIQLYNTVSRKLKTLSDRDGITSFKISGIEIFSSKVVFSSNKGLFSIDKNNVFKKQKEPLVYFSDVKVNEISVSHNKQLLLNHNHNSISFHFMVNGFHFNQKGRYQYRLIGLNPNWVTLKNGENSVKYNSLPSGEYVFQVQPILNSGNLIAKPKQIKFVIKSPYWQKWWFYVVLSLTAITLSWLLLYYFSFKKQQKQVLAIKQEKAEKELLFSQLENLRSQMNPHFIFNALNSIQEYIMTNDKNLASTYLVKFSRLIRMYLNHSRNQEVILKDEIQALKLYLDLEKDRFDDTLEFVIDIEPNLLNQNIYVPSLFIQPYVENAIKHGLLHKHKDRILRVTFYIQNKNLICEVEDNGIGRKESQKIKSKRVENHQSFATSANERRVALLNKMRENKINVRIEDLYSSNIASGTKVLIEIPIESYESNNN